MYKSGKAELVKACRQANRELRKHRLYLDQLLAIVVDRHPEILTLVAEAQNMRSDTMLMLNDLEVFENFTKLSISTGT